MIFSLLSPPPQRGAHSPCLGFPCQVLLGKVGIRFPMLSLPDSREEGEKKGLKGGEGPLDAIWDVGCPWPPLPAAPMTGDLAARLRSGGCSTAQRGALGSSESLPVPARWGPLLKIWGCWGGTEGPLDGRRCARPQPAHGGEGVGVSIVTSSEWSPGIPNGPRAVGFKANRL